MSKREAQLKDLQAAAFSNINRLADEKAALLAENERLRALLTEAEGWFVSLPDPGALASSEHFLPGCPNDLAALIAEIRAALAATKDGPK